MFPAFAYFPVWPSGSPRFPCLMKPAVREAPGAVPSVGPRRESRYSQPRQISCCLQLLSGSVLPTPIVTCDCKRRWKLQLSVQLRSCPSQSLIDTVTDCRSVGVTKRISAISPDSPKQVPDFTPFANSQFRGSMLTVSYVPRTQPNP